LWVSYVRIDFCLAGATVAIESKRPFPSLQNTSIDSSQSFFTYKKITLFISVTYVVVTIMDSL
jgi:hypothetical protein